MAAAEPRKQGELKEKDAGIVLGRQDGPKDGES